MSYANLTIEKMKAINYDCILRTGGVFDWLEYLTRGFCGTEEDHILAGKVSEYYGWSK